MSVLYNAPNTEVKHIINNPTSIFPLIKRGDVIRFGENNYRNENKYIYDGKKMVELSEDIDEYGHLPHQFTLNEFPYSHFDNTIDHNNVRWLNISSEKCIKGIDRVFPADDSLYDAVFLVEINNIVYKILIPPHMSLCDTPGEIYEYLRNQKWFNEWNQSIPLEIAEMAIGGYDDDIYMIYTPFSGGVFYSEDGLIDPDYEYIDLPEGYTKKSVSSTGIFDKCKDTKKEKINITIEN